MGLKWFRARLSMEEEASKVQPMTGLYRRFSDYSESTNWKNAEVSVAKPPSVASYSMASDDNETMEYNRSKADLVSQTSSSIIDLEEITVKDDVKKLQISNYTVNNEEPSTSIKDPNIEQQSTHGKKSNKTTKDQNDAKSPICSDNELVI
ncbi:uncharacterized protein LOC105199001 [Solenopsis invicta]|uniref:uncharacterized protein LOC105199001 n=1 Tax=Solenopsis invicta TaxID=13686 RepID=UPI000595BD69|nr:uncharacterized protein LOC105199001 [Solenopsis invicta]XP_039315230.1 uncharacterized protein LOC105199001 [Solenopsis invicta]